MSFNYTNPFSYNNPYSDKRKKLTTGMAFGQQQLPTPTSNQLGGAPPTLPGGYEIPRDERSPDYIPKKEGLFETKAFKGSLKDNWNKPEYWLGADIKTIKKEWGDSGGMDGLMANPGFILGLTMMQNAAQGKRLNESLLNDVATASGISNQYKQKLADKASIIEATPSQIAATENFLKEEFNVSGPIFAGWRRDKRNKWNRAVEQISNKLENKIAERKKEAKRKGKKLTIDTAYKRKIFNEMKASGEITVHGPKWAWLEEIWGPTAQARAEGGPVQANTAYLVGERGPEVFTPKQSGNIVTNDDAMVTSMLLKANPDLQNLSAKRAERILKVQFPEYYDKN